MNAQPINQPSLKKKRTRSRGERLDNKFKQDYRYMDRNITECLNDYLSHTNNNEKLERVQFSNFNSKIKKEKLREHFLSNENNQSVIDFLCEQPEIKDFLNKTFQEVYDTYYIKEEELPFKTDKFISITKLNEEKEKKKQQLEIVLNDKNWINNKPLSVQNFKAHSKPLKEFFKTIKQFINDKLDESGNTLKLRRVPELKRKIFLNKTKLKDFWSRKGRKASEEEMKDVLDCVAKQEKSIKNILESTLENLLNEYYRNKTPNFGKNDDIETETETSVQLYTDNDKILFNVNTNYSINDNQEQTTKNETQYKTNAIGNVNFNHNPKEMPEEKINSNQSSQDILEGSKEEIPIFMEC